jgi:hypothetical protein
MDILRLPVLFRQNRVINSEKVHIRLRIEGGNATPKKVRNDSLVVCL